MNAIRNGDSIRKLVVVAMTAASLAGALAAPATAAAATTTAFYKGTGTACNSTSLNKYRLWTNVSNHSIAWTHTPIRTSLSQGQSSQVTLTFVKQLTVGASATVSGSFTVSDVIAEATLTASMAMEVVGSKTYSTSYTLTANGTGPGPQTYAVYAGSDQAYGNWYWDLCTYNSTAKIYSWSNRNSGPWSGYKLWANGVVACKDKASFPTNSVEYAAITKVCV